MARELVDSCDILLRVVERYVVGVVEEILLVSCSSISLVVVTMSLGRMKSLFCLK
jgi:hypothetical protein